MFTTPESSERPDPLAPWKTILQKILHSEPTPSPEWDGGAAPSASEGVGAEWWVPARQFSQGSLGHAPGGFSDLSDDFWSGPRMLRSEPPLAPLTGARPHSNVIELLIKHGADPNAHTGRGGG